MYVKHRYLLSDFSIILHSKEYFYSIYILPLQIYINIYSKYNALLLFRIIIVIVVLAFRFCCFTL